MNDRALAAVFFLSAVLFTLALTNPASLSTISSSADHITPLTHVASGTDLYPSEAAYSLALHIHGSMSEQFGSMEWHTAKAESAGVDVIWWSDHDQVMSSFRGMNKFNFETAVWEATHLRWSESDDAWPGNFRYWQGDVPSLTFLDSSISDTLAYEGSRAFVLSTDGAPGSEYSSGHFAQTAMQLNNRYSLAKRVRLSFAFFPENLDPQNARFVLETELSDHPDGTKILRYIAGSMEGEGVHSIPLSFTPGEWNTYTLEVTQDAIQHFSTGGIDTLRAEDNALAMVRIGLETCDGTSARVLFDDYRIAYDPLLVDNVLLDRARAIGGYYETLYPSVTHYAGSEISRFNAQPHLNAFAPDLELVNYTGHDFDDTLYYAIDQVHAQGGAVSLNHIFGPRYDHQFNPNEPPQQQAARLLWWKQKLIANRAIGVDILEVGYRRRGGMDLVHHLDLWDVLNANTIWLTANGVTDSHGRGEHEIMGWGPAENGLAFKNNFVTWLWTEEPSERGFVLAMKRGRAYFGDPYRWDGELDLRTEDGFRMGQVVFTDQDQHDLIVSVTDLPADAKVRLVQIEIREPPSTSYTTVNLLRDQYLAGEILDGNFEANVSLDTSLPSLARIEIYNSNDGELVFSNPVHFVRDVPAFGIPAERVAVRLDDLRVFLAEKVRFRGASFDSGSEILTIACDEETEGLGSVSIDPGPRGAPTSVSGAESWNYQGGVLTLQGFSGIGSLIGISWGATDAAVHAETPSHVQLEAPGPNPFGEGVLVKYALPKDGNVRLEVFDVRGARVASIEQSHKSAGHHEARWDGRSRLGTVVSSGVYWVRLEFDGETRIRRAVKLE